MSKKEKIAQIEKRLAQIGELKTDSGAEAYAICPMLGGYLSEEEYEQYWQNQPDFYSIFSEKEDIMSNLDDVKYISDEYPHVNIEYSQKKGEVVVDDDYGESWTEGEYNELDRELEQSVTDTSALRSEKEELEEQLYELTTPEEEREEAYSRYLEDKADFESNLNSYYGWCMNGGGGREEFRKMYGDGDYFTFAQWRKRN